MQTLMTTTSVMEELEGLGASDIEGEECQVREGREGGEGGEGREGGAGGTGGE